jgi:hypothetical protein
MEHYQEAAAFRFTVSGQKTPAAFQPRGFGLLGRDPEKIQAGKGDFQETTVVEFRDRVYV